MINPNIFLQQIVVSKRFSLWRHLSLLLSLSIIMLSFVWYIPLTYVPQYYRFYAWGIYLLLFVLIIYGNIYYFVPKLLLKDKIAKYILVLFIFVIVIILCILGVQVFLLKKVPQNEFNLFFFMSNISSACFICAFLLLGTSSIALMRYWILADLKRVQMEKSILESELRLLKNQVNPHFLFNMLNNANMLLKKDKEQASKVFYRLEDLLRYQMNDNVSEDVLLTADIQFFNDYLHLEKVRRDNFTYSIRTKGQIDNVRVPALFFIIFIENSVKHNPDNGGVSYVDIIFEIEDNILHFYCENSKPDYPLFPDTAVGIGLKNIKRRLSILYPENQSLKIIDGKIKFMVDLKLTL